MNLALGAGVPVFFAEEELHLDPKDPEAIRCYAEAVSQACNYLATMVRKCRAGRFDRADIDHRLPSNTKMFGFDIIDGRRVLNQAQAEALREAAQIALREGRLAPAAKYLNDKGFITTQGKPFTRVTLRGLFRNRALIGETVVNFKEKMVVLKHDRILDDAAFEALQVMLDGHRRSQRSEVFYCLSGLSFCGCGARFEASKTGAGRYYYRCERHCGERTWRKGEPEWEVNEAFGRYLQRRESQRECLELAQKSRAKLQNGLDQVERDIAENGREWRTLLDKELADYPAIIIDDKKRELTAERESLLRAKTKIKAQLDELPQVDWAEVELALVELAKSWQKCNTGGYGIPNPMSWERASVAEAIEAQQAGDKERAAKLLALTISTPDMPRKLTDEQAHLLREMLLKLNCRITISNRVVVINGKLPLTSVRAKEDAS